MLGDVKETRKRLNEIAFNLDSRARLIRNRLSEIEYSSRETDKLRRTALNNDRYCLKEETLNPPTWTIDASMGVIKRFALCGEPLAVAVRDKVEDYIRSNPIRDSEMFNMGLSEIARGLLYREFNEKRYNYLLEGKIFFATFNNKDLYIDAQEKEAE